MQFTIIWQSYSDKFRVKGKRLYNSFQKRRYSAKLRNLDKQKRKLEDDMKLASTLLKLTVEQKDELKKRIQEFEKKETKFKRKIAKY